jgi:hypothetical protein
VPVLADRATVRHAEPIAVRRSGEVEAIARRGRSPRVGDRHRLVPSSDPADGRGMALIEARARHVVAVRVDPA